MGVGAGLYMYVVVVQKFTFAISSPDEFLSQIVSPADVAVNSPHLERATQFIGCVVDRACKSIRDSTNQQVVS